MPVPQHERRHCCPAQRYKNLINLCADIAGQSTADLINQALSENPKCQEALSVIGTKIIAFEITPGLDDFFIPAVFPVTLIPETLSTVFLTIQDGELALNSISDEALLATANVTVRGNLMALLLLVCLESHKPESDQNIDGNIDRSIDNWINTRTNSLTISGDQALLSEVISILQQVDIDWEARLATVIGDIPAHLLGESIRKTKAWAEDSHQRLWESYQNYRNEEQQIHSGNSLGDLIANFSSWLDPNRFNRP